MSYELLLIVIVWYKTKYKDCKFSFPHMWKHLKQL